jgi:hypothetical protein
MKKILFLCFVAICFGFTSQAQTTDKTKVETSTKVKHTKSLKDRVHNTLHPKRKHYSGVKVKKEIKKDN